MYTAAAVFALSAAFLLALRDTFGRLAVRGIDPVLGSSVTAVVSLIVLTSVSAAMGDFRTPLPASGRPAVYIALAGVLRITAARTLILAATQHIGSARTSATNSTNVFFASAIGVLFQGDPLEMSFAAGSVLVLAGSILVARSGSGQTGPISSRNNFKGIGFALMSALALGVSTVLARKGIPAFASANQANLYATAAGAIAFLPFLSGKLSKAELGSWPAKTWGLLCLTGAVASLGVTFLYLALARAPVVFAFPIAQSRPLFVIAIAWIFFQMHERINLRVVAGAAAIITGAVTLEVIS
ncbi:MAG: EamA family transporter [Nitrospinota bacterium]|nr:EamA family transporter [Nitrospinota bacterium]